MAISLVPDLAEVLTARQRLICTGGNISPAQLASLWTGRGERP